MKKVLSFVMVVIVAIGLMIPAFSSAESVKGHKTMYVVCADGKRLNVRSTPSTKARVLYRVNNGGSVTIIHSKKAPAGWAVVRKGGKPVGYVMTKFLKAHKPGKYALTERSDNFKKVNSYTVKAKALKGKKTESVGLRLKPTKKSSAIRRLVAGDRLTVIARGKTWSKVKDFKTGRIGYVANAYIAKV